MDYIFSGIQQAFYLIFSLDREVFNIVLLSLKVSLIALLFASLLGVPIGFLITINNYIGKKLIIIIMNTFLAFPTVVVGLIVYSFISRRGPFGALGLLFTPTAMIIGQFILAIPIIMVLTHSAVQGIDKKVKKTALTLGATELQSAWAVLTEARYAILEAITFAFGRVISEVGAAIMLGGNIKGSTRTMTTAISFETSKGEFGFGIALGVILLLIALIINIFHHYFQFKKV